MTAELTVIQPALSTLGNPDTLLPGTQIEGLEIRDVIGIGGFGIVYKAWDPMLQRMVALKEYLPTALSVRMASGLVKVREEQHRDVYEAGLRSFVNEARLLAQFDHPALVKVYRFWEMCGTAYMVMPLYQGVTLKQYVMQHAEPLPETVLLNWLVALTEALETLHAQQCVHRDVSLENIIIQEGTGLPILLDFGAARRAIGNVAQPFTVILKASYAPIEQYAEVPSTTQGPWTDVYALAAVAHYLMTGKTPPSSVGRLVNDSYVPLVSRLELPFNECIKQAVDHALTVQPHERTASMAEFRAALQLKPVAKNDSRKTVQPAQTITTIKQPIAPSKIVLIIAALVVAAALAVVAAFKWPGTATNSTPENTSPTQVGNNTASTPEQAESELPAHTIAPAFDAVLSKADSPLSIHMENPVLKIGEDLLRFQIESPISGYAAVYVLSSDHSLIQLLPNVRVPQLAIKANEKTWLPPSSEPLQASGPAGTNQFLVIVTQKPRSYAHLSMTDHYGFGLIQGEPTQLEGMSSCPASDCEDRLVAAWFSVDEVD